MFARNDVANDGDFKFTSIQDQEKADCEKIRVKHGQIDYVYEMTGKLANYFLFGLGLILVLILGLALSGLLGR